MEAPTHLIGNPDGERHGPVRLGSLVALAVTEASRQGLVHELLQWIDNG